MLIVHTHMTISPRGGEVMVVSVRSEMRRRIIEVTCRSEFSCPFSDTHLDEISTIDRNGKIQL